MLKSCLYVNNSHGLTNEAQEFMQELQLWSCRTVEFIDEYRLLACFMSRPRALPSLVVMDTGKDAASPPTQTHFRLPDCLIGAGRLSLLLERGMHKPSPAETLAPFHQDPAQRIITLHAQSTLYYLTFQVGPLLKLLQGREGSEIEWDEWKSRVVIPSIEKEPFRIWVSGCRLFCIGSTHYDQDERMEVYNFSMRGRAKYLSERDHGAFEGVRYLSSTGVKARAPCEGILIPRSGHDSTVFSYVSVGIFCPLLRWG